MAQSPLTRAAIAGAILVAGAATELAAPQSSALTTADFVVGSGIGCSGAYLLDGRPRTACLALATAAAWFAGTLAGANGVLGGVGTALLISYRGPLLHMLLEIRQERAHRLRLQALAAAGWAAALLPLSLAGPATSAIAVLVTTRAATRARAAAADEQQIAAATAVAGGLLATIWLVSALALAGGADWLLFNDAAVLAAAAVMLSSAGGIWSRSAARAVVVELGPSRRPGQPLTTRLSRALADPDLEIRYRVTGFGWVDEQGRATSAPDDRAQRVTLANAPEGDEIALIHGATATTDRRLAAAAAAAAAVALEAARLEADMRAAARDVRVSRRRLLAVADTERRMLEQQLSDSVLARLRRVDRLLTEPPRVYDVERSQLGSAMSELLALGRGLYPPALARADLARSLTELAEHSPIPTSVHVEGSLEAVPDTHRAALWFVCSEALTNVARHASASNVVVTLRADHDHLELTIHDNGHGGATLVRGLRGLADRVDALNGDLTLTSPTGGPTIVRATLPR